MPSLDLTRAAALAHAGQAVAEVAHLGTVVWQAGPPAPPVGVTLASRLVFSNVPQSGGTGNAPHDLTPLNLRPGDLVTVVFSISSNVRRTPNLTSGWTAASGPLQSGPSGTRILSQHLFYKVMGSEPDAIVALDTNSSGAFTSHYYVWRGFDPDNPVSFLHHPTPGTRIADPPPVTPTMPGSAICVVVAASHHATEDLGEFEDPEMVMMKVNSERSNDRCSSASWWLPWAGGTYDPPPVQNPGSVETNNSGSVVLVINPAV